LSPHTDALRDSKSGDAVPKATVFNEGGIGEHAANRRGHTGSGVEDALSIGILPGYDAAVGASQGALAGLQAGQGNSRSFGVGALRAAVAGLSLQDQELVLSVDKKVFEIRRKAEQKHNIEEDPPRRSAVEVLEDTPEKPTEPMPLKTSSVDWRYDQAYVEKIRALQESLKKLRMEKKATKGEEGEVGKPISGTMGDKLPGKAGRQRRITTSSAGDV